MWKAKLRLKAAHSVSPPTHTDSSLTSSLAYEGRTGQINISICLRA